MGTKELFALVNFELVLSHIWEYEFSPWVMGKRSTLLITGKYIKLQILVFKFQKLERMNFSKIIKEHGQVLGIVWKMKNRTHPFTYPFWKFLRKKILRYCSTIYDLFIWKAKRWRVTNRQNPPIHWFSIHMPATAKAEPAQFGSIELNLVLEFVFQGSQNVSHRLLSSQGISARSWDLEWSQNRNPDTTMWECTCPSNVLTLCRTPNPTYSFYIKLSWIHTVFLSLRL